MEKPFQYKLATDSAEAQYRASRDEIERKQLLRIFGMATVLITVFFLIDALSLSNIPGFFIGITARAAGLIAAILGIIKVRKSYVSTKDEHYVFICGLVVILHILVNNFIQHYDPISIAAWDIAAIFAIYSLTPIRVYQQMALALILTIGSQILWITVAVPQLSIVEILATPLAYLAANCFGITISLNINRSQRLEFTRLKSEQELRSNLERTMETLKSTMNTRDQLFSVLAHDLRGPIGALSAIGKLLDSANPIAESKREHLINLLCVGSKTSYDLLDNLLNWALSESGNLEPEIVRVDLQNAIESNIDLLASSASNKNILLTTDSSQRLAIQADRKMLDTILRNLIANAIKFTNKGGEIKILQKLGENETVNISIEDNGIGIEPSRLEQLFNLNFKDTSEGTEGENGSNLGLRIVSDFTKKQAGKITVASQPNKGTKITLTFPIAIKRER